MADIWPSLRGADLALLGALDVLLEEANVTRAAARLHVSQPARLRELVGDPLLIPARQGRGMTLTTRALAMRDSLRAALQQVDAALNRGIGFDPARDARTFQLLASDNGTVMVGLDLLRQIAATAPQVQVGIQNVPALQAGAWLERGAADLLICADFAVPPGLHVQPLLRERYVMAQRKGHPRGTSASDLEAYCALGHVLVSGDGGNFHGFMDDLLARQGRSRQVRVSVQQYHMAPLVLAVTDHVCVLPERFLARFDHLDLLPLPPEVQVDGFVMHAAWHPRHEADAAHR
ncbi:MAG: PCP degradation transcriptional activation protein [Stenotrophomonas maltophilia]|uniref:PCP degradation transcriptional activation protein n=1 Tax=Stenotrophomonas maltophilia TaxID=40324 RepID=A0A7V8JMY3_STEMA|nr:MAG: PCP degradation transcriptional activation protein [Stenotrophomonas maltophilia]